jgi:hypothetical protein
MVDCGIHALEVADGIKDALINADLTIERILSMGPLEVASILGIDQYVAEIIFNATLKVVNIHEHCNITKQNTLVYQIKTTMT